MTPGRVVLLCAAVLAGQASIGWSNDWLDADRDRAVGRTDKPVVQGGVRPELLRSAALGAAAVAVVLSLLLGLVPGVLLLTLVGSGWAYNAGLKRTWLSWLGYVVGFGALPAGVVAAGTGHPVGSLVAGVRGGRAGRGRAPGQRRPRPRGRPGDRRPRAAAPPRRPAVRAPRRTPAGRRRRSPWCSDPDGPPTAAGWVVLALAVPAVVVAALAGEPRFRKAAFPAVLLLTVLDVVLLLIGGATVT